MNNQYDLLLEDIEKISRIPIVPTMLDVVCKATGMGFAAIARVTDEKWIACSVRDEILFGLKPGEELELKSTICNEIRTTHNAVIIDNVSESAEFCDHHTPKQYGFKSYISVPIFLKNGDFFGTLCAIDPKPAKLNNVQTIGMFNLFADLISFHLQSIDLIQRSLHVVTDLSTQLEHSSDENNQFRFISNHNLQEPLRKLRLYSDSLLHVSANEGIEKAKSLASKINASAEKFSLMIKDVSSYSDVKIDQRAIEELDLNIILDNVRTQLRVEKLEQQPIITSDKLPKIEGSRIYIGQLFRHLVNHAVIFSKDGVAPVLHVSSGKYVPEQSTYGAIKPNSEFVRIVFQNSHLSMHQSELEKVFNILYTQAFEKSDNTIESNLPRCRKIVRLHYGTISAELDPAGGTNFVIVLPVKNAVSRRA